jgi:hypothetical protein
MFKCQTCNTLMSIETDLTQDKIHMAPPCPCGKSRMLSLNSYEYAYGDLENRTGWDS